MALQFLRTLVGSERLLLGSDYPFPMADPDPVQRCIQAGFPAAETAAIMGDSARALFRLG